MGRPGLGSLEPGDEWVQGARDTDDRDKLSRVTWSGCEQEHGTCLTDNEQVPTACHV